MGTLHEVLSVSADFQISIRRRLPVTFGGIALTTAVQHLSEDWQLIPESLFGSKSLRRHSFDVIPDFAALPIVGRFRKCTLSDT